MATAKLPKKSFARNAQPDKAVPAVRVANRARPEPPQAVAAKAVRKVLPAVPRPADAEKVVLPAADNPRPVAKVGRSVPSSRSSRRV